MDKVFEQKKFFVKHMFTVKDEGVEIYTKDFDGEYTKHVQFEKVEPRDKCRLYTENFPRLLQIGLSISGVSLIKWAISSGVDYKHGLMMSGIMLGIGLLTVLAYYLIRIKYLLIELEDDTQIFVMVDVPDKEKMESFVDYLYMKRKENYRENYFYVNYEGVREKEISRMQWLRKEEIISEDEFNVIVDEINENLE